MEIFVFQRKSVVKEDVELCSVWRQ